MVLPAGDSELIQIMDAAFADAARRAGAGLVCREGCTPCCHGAFVINALDAARLREGMDVLRATNPELAAEIERRAHAWIDEFGAEFPGDVSTGKLGTSDENREHFEDFANDAACPALDLATGRCDVYAWRPMTCRVFGPPVRIETRMDAGEDAETSALGHCELCFVGATRSEVKDCEMQVPHDLEAELVDEMGDDSETVVAFALRRTKSSQSAPR